MFHQVSRRSRDQAIKPLLCYWREAVCSYLLSPIPSSMSLWAAQFRRYLPISQGKNWDGLSKIQAWFLGCKGQCLEFPSGQPATVLVDSQLGCKLQHLGEWCPRGQVPCHQNPSCKAQPHHVHKDGDQTLWKRKFQIDCSGWISGFSFSATVPESLKA